MKEITNHDTILIEPISEQKDKLVRGRQQFLNSEKYRLAIKMFSSVEANELLKRDGEMPLSQLMLTLIEKYGKEAPKAVLLEIAGIALEKWTKLDFTKGVLNRDIDDNFHLGSFKLRQGVEFYTVSEVQRLLAENPDLPLQQVILSVVGSYAQELPTILLLDMVQLIADEWTKFANDKEKIKVVIA
jgi:hypothetical protein